MKKDTKYIPVIQGHAIVAGGSGGIGREVVRSLVANGVEAISFTYGRNKEVAEELGRELTEAGVATYFASVDRLDEKGFQKFLVDAEREVKKDINMAVDAIGISPNKDHLEWTVEDMRSVYETNVIGSALFLRSVAERMLSHKVKGSIVLITSSNGVNSQAPYSFAYDGSKADQAQVMRTLAEPYARQGVRINAVAPGWIQTAMNDTLPPGEKEKETSKIWAQRFADPAEVASVIVFLLGTGASYIYGQNILVDGGYR